MPLWCLRELACLHLCGGGLERDTIVFLSHEMANLDIGPRTNTEVIEGEEGAYEGAY